MNKYLKKFIELKYRFFSIIEDDLVVFSSFGGKYCDNPRVISEELHKLNANKKIVWLIKDMNNSDIPDYVTKIDINTLEAKKYYHKAKIIIDNVYGSKECYLYSNNFIAKLLFKVKTFINSKKNQYVITTWHGTPLKKMGIDEVNSKIIDFSCPNTVMVLGDEYTLNIMRRLTFNKIKMLLTGSPRNDILYNEQIDKYYFRKKLGLNNCDNIILFAPSFRENINNDGLNINRSGLNQLEMMDIDKMFKSLEEKFGGNWTLVCRFHYHVEEKVDWDKLHEKYGNRIINGNEGQDIMEYLKCTDVLITDVSSCMFDYAITEKPIFMFFPDIDDYSSKERGLYLNMENLPFSCSTTFDGFINNIDSFDNEDYINKVKRFKEKLNYSKEKNSGKKIAELIIKGDIFEKDN